jgi:predicted SAM-dependent methyltransferase
MHIHGWEATGLEPDWDARKIAEENYHIKLENTDQFYNLTPASFDAITLWHVLEHIHDLHPYLEQLKKLLKNNGKLVVAVPNYTSSDAKKYKQHWAAFDVPRHLYHFSPLSIIKLMNSHQLSIIHFKPMLLDSFYISLLSSKYKNGKINWIAAGWNGLWSDIVTLRNKKKSSSVIYIITK